MHFENIIVIDFTKLSRIEITKGEMKPIKHYVTKQTYL